MVVNQISEVLVKRRTALIEMLENNRDSLDLEKQHQVFGAINELELFLHTLDYYQKNSTEGEDAVRLVKPPMEEESANVFYRIFQGIKGKVKRN